MRVLTTQDSRFAGILARWSLIFLLIGHVGMLQAAELHGHRGARGLAPENTIPSFREALRHGVDCIEIDVGMTKDRSIVIHHDRTLNPNIARLDGKWIADPVALKQLTINELVTYDVGRLRPDTRYALKYPKQVAVDGTRIPLLQDLLTMPELTTNKRTCLNIEIKTSPLKPDETFSPSQISEALIDVLKQHDFQDRVRIQSFDWRNLVHIKKIAPNIPLSFLSAERSWLDNVETGAAGPSDWLGGIDIDDFGGSLPKAIKHLGGAIWAPYYRDVKADDIELAHTLGLKVIVWTVNSADAMQKMLALKVDGIITDYPDVGRREIDAWLATKR